MDIKQKGKRMLQGKGLLLICIVIFAALSILIPSFFTVRNMLTLGRQMAVIGIAAVGLTFVMISGNSVDLSIGSIISLSGVVCCYIMTNMANEPMAMALGLVAALVIGILIGLVNGVMVAGVGINPFIMTVITQMFFEGIALSITKGNTIGLLPKPFLQIAKAEILGIPTLIFVLLLFVLAGQYIFRQNFIGRIIYAVGSNKKGAELVGISATKVQILCYMFSGVCGGIAGVILSSRLSSASSAMGANILLDIISAVIIGGASIFGGKGTVFGTVAGVLIIGLIGNAINLLGISHNLSMVLKGLIVLFAVIMDVMRQNTSKKRLLEN